MSSYWPMSLSSGVSSGSWSSSRFSARSFSDIIYVPEVCAIKFSHPMKLRLNEIGGVACFAEEDTRQTRIEWAENFFISFSVRSGCAVRATAWMTSAILLAVRHLVAPFLFTKITRGISDECFSWALRKTIRNAFVMGHISGCSRSAIFFEPWPFCWFF